LRSAWTNISGAPILKIPFTKKEKDGVAQGVRPEFKPQNHKKRRPETSLLNISKSFSLKDKS
jgi:hypothetical protein